MYFALDFVLAPKMVALMVEKSMQKMSSGQGAKKSSVKVLEIGSNVEKLTVGGLFESPIQTSGETALNSLKATDVLDVQGKIRW